MKPYNLFYFSLFLLLHEITVCMDKKIVSREQRINQLKENPAQIKEILKEKSNCLLCFGTPEHIEIAQEAERELQKDTKEIQSLRTEELNQKILNFNSYQIRLLKKIQLENLFLETINKLKDNQLKALSEPKLLIMIENFKDLFNYKDTENTENIYNDINNIKNILDIISKFNKISDSLAIKNSLYALKKIIYQNLTSKELQEISNHLKNEDLFEVIKYHFNSQLDHLLKKQLTHNFVNNPHEFNLEYIPYINIHELEPLDIPNLSPEQIKKLRLEQIQNFTDAQIEALSSNQVHAFSKGQLMNLSNYQIGHLLASQKISLKQIENLSPKILNSIDPQVIEKLSLDQLDVLTDNQIKELSIRIKFSLLKRLIKVRTNDDAAHSKIKNIIIRINNTITYLSKKYFNYYHKTLFKDLQNKIPSLKFFAQLHGLTIDEIKALTQEKFESLDDEEKNEVFEEIENYYQLISQENITHTLNQYNSLDIQNFIYNLANQKDKKISSSAEDSTENSTQDLAESTVEIKDMNDNTVTMIIAEGYPEDRLKKKIYTTLNNYYKKSSYEEIQKDLQHYQSSFIKKILISIMNEKDANVPPKKHSRVNIDKKVTIDETKNILHYPIENNSSNNSATNSTKNITLRHQDFYAKSITQDQVILLNDEDYNKLLQNIREYYEYKDAKTILNDIKFYQSRNLQQFLYELINEKNNPKKPKKSKARVPFAPSLPAQSSSDFTSSGTAQSLSDTTTTTSTNPTNTSFNASNNNFDENLFHRPQ